jgi:hypothetical protein
MSSDTAFHAYSAQRPSWSSWQRRPDNLLTTPAQIRFPVIRAALPGDLIGHRVPLCRNRPVRKCAVQIWLK